MSYLSDDAKIVILGSKLTKKLEFIGILPFNLELM